MKIKPYVLTVLFLISWGIFCISCFKVAVMAVSGIAWGYYTRALYDYVGCKK